VTTIAVDIRANHETGVARYGRSLLSAAAAPAANEGVRLLAIVREGEQASVANVAAAGHEVLEVSGDKGFIRDNAHLRDLLAQREVDLYYTSHYTVDRECPVPFAFTIHDLTRWRFPDLSYTDAAFTTRFGLSEMERLEKALADLTPYDTTGPQTSLFTRYFTAVSRELTSRAQRIVTVSSATAYDITSLLAVPTDRIDLVPCAVDSSTFQVARSDAVQAVRARYGLDVGPYLIFVGLAHPNKRFEWLVEQLVSARDTLPVGARLAAVGGHADQVPAVRKFLHDRDLTDFVAFTGRVTDSELAALYTGAAAWITASINEGNNLPPMEAMACGTEVIATDIPPLRETLGDSAHFYPAYDGAALTEAARAALADTLPHRAQTFEPPTWERSGRLLVDSWLRALSS
jgi:glycosyltransferase involved in cell wall biosynthesis